MISIIIPTLNNENLITTTISQLKENAYTRLIKEIIVVDAGSSDKTVTHAQEAGATVVHSITKNRSSLFNLGAQQATGKILYFITPGSVPPKHFTNQIVSAIQKGCSAGTFSVKFEQNHWLLKCISAITSVRTNLARLEDQSLFVIKELFEKAGSFREDMMAFEDLEVMRRIRRYSGFVILKDALTSTTKKYVHGNILRIQTGEMLARLVILMGYSQQKALKLLNLISGNREKKPAGIQSSLSTAY